jgi:predicted PurR-regulated permease PerM
MASSYRSQILFAFAIAVALYLAYAVRDVIFLIYLAALSAIVLMPVVEAICWLRIRRWHPGRGLAIAIILIVGLGLLGLFLAFALPPLIDDIQAIAANWPERIAWLMQKSRHLGIEQQVDVNAIQRYAANMAGTVLGLFKNVFNSLMAFGSWLLLTIYFVIDGARAFRWSMSFFPPEMRVRLEPALMRGQHRMRRWLLGQLILMLILGCSSALAFGLLKVKYSYALAVLTGLANIVPIAGPLFTIVLAGAVAAIDSFGKLIGVLVFYAVYQQVENTFLTPNIMHSTVDLPPLAVIVALILGGSLAGIVGALVAVPTAALIAVLLDEYLVYHDPQQSYLTALRHESRTGSQG